MPDDIVPQFFPLPCLLCRKELESIVKPGPQPAGAVMFTSPGTFGSGVFDDIDGSRLQINICDECLISNHDLVWYTQERKVTKILKSYPWVPVPVEIGEENDD